MWVQVVLIYTIVRPCDYDDKGVTLAWYPTESSARAVCDRLNSFGKLYRDATNQEYRDKIAYLARTVDPEWGVWCESYTVEPLPKGGQL